MNGFKCCWQSALSLRENGCAIACQIPAAVLHHWVVLSAQGGRLPLTAEYMALIESSSRVIQLEPGDHGLIQSNKQHASSSTSYTSTWSSRGHWKCRGAQRPPYVATVEECSTYCAFCFQSLVLSDAARAGEARLCLLFSFWDKSSVSTLLYCSDWFALTLQNRSFSANALNA